MTITLTVYLGSSGYARPVFKEAAIRLGAMVARHGHRLVYGGMDAGLMGLLAQQALKTGAHVTGIIPKNLKDSERILPGLSETILVADLGDRKRRLFQRADAVIALPGGFGTADESLEMLYWAGLGLHRKKLLLVNIGDYWSPLLDHLRNAPDFNPDFLILCSDIEDVFKKLPGLSLSKTQAEASLPHFEDEITRATEEPIFIDTATLENTYYAVCALGLKQLGKHKRPIGFLNRNGQFDNLLRWFERAAAEHFITEKCLKLYAAHEDETALREMLKTRHAVAIDLHREKWGQPVIEGKAASGLDE